MIVNLNQSAAAVGILTNPAKDLKPTDSSPTFEQQLLSVFKAYSGHVEIDVQRQNSQNPGTRQFLVTVKDDVAPPALENHPGPLKFGVETNHKISSADLYWAQQPPEVQALRNIPDEATRTEVAQKLSAQGFSIDLPIMVWGYDPLVMMTIRKNSGFTWYPSMNNEPVLAPGITFPGYKTYDPNKPPPGAIIVSTDFAKGATAQEPWG